MTSNLFYLPFKSSFMLWSRNLPKMHSTTQVVTAERL